MQSHTCTNIHVLTFKNVKNAWAGFQFTFHSDQFEYIFQSKICRLKVNQLYFLFKGSAKNVLYIVLDGVLGFHLLLLQQKPARPQVKGQTGGLHILTAFLYRFQFFSEWCQPFFRSLTYFFLPSNSHLHKSHGSTLACFPIRTPQQVQAVWDPGSA